MWLGVILCKVKVYLTCCYIPHQEFNYNNLYVLDHDDLVSNVCVDILTHEKIGNVLVVGYFNVKVDDNIMLFIQHVAQKLVSC